MKSLRRRFLLNIAKVHKIVSIAEATAGDVCLYDIQNESYVIVNGKFCDKDFPLTNFTPIGIVAIPGSHEIYGENTCSIISLTEMCASSPTTGSVDSTSTLSWGPQADVGTLKNFNVVVVMNGTTLSTNGFGYLSKNGKYASTTLCIPDPYNEDMSRNPDYYNTSISAYNAMSDFNGKSNTKAIITLRGTKDYGTWKPTYNTANDYPAASCCDMFYTEGTNQGDWYLPSAGEWGYVTSKWDKIRNSFNIINEAYGNISIAPLDNSSYWTSTDHNAKNARYVHTNNGMGHTTKTTAQRARAMLIIKES